MRSGAFLVVMVLASAPARADKSSEAREHYQSATSHFAVGEFAEAATEYQAAYMLKADPALLFNAAQSYRLASNPDKALILYKNYLQLYPNEPNADEVRQQIERLKEAIAAEKPKTAPTGTVAPTQSPPSSSPEAALPATAKPAASPLVSQPAASAKSETPVYKKWWLWTVVGVVIAGGAVTTAVLLTRPSKWSNAPDVGPGSSNALVRW